VGEVALMDLDDLEHNTRDGLHIASLAGTWIGLVAGFAGLRDDHGRTSFAPRLPESLTRLAVTILIRDRRLHLEITHSSTAYQLLDGEPLEVLHDREALTVSTGAAVVRPTQSLPGLKEPTQPDGRAPRRRTGHY